MVSSIFGANTTVAVTVESRHGLLGEEGEGLFENCLWRKGRWMISIVVNSGRDQNRCCCRTTNEGRCMWRSDLPLRLLLLGLVAMLKAARRASRERGSMNMIKVVKESRWNDGINCKVKGLRKESIIVTSGTSIEVIHD